MEQRIANKGEIADESALKSTQDVSSGIEIYKFFRMICTISMRLRFDGESGRVVGGFLSVVCGF